MSHCPSIECSVEALYNVIQEAKENEVILFNGLSNQDLRLLLIDCRDEKAYEENHIVQSINIPSSSCSFIS